MAVKTETTFSEKLESYFDPHMKIMIYDYLVENKCIDHEKGVKLQIEYARKTKMVTYLITLINQLEENAQEPQAELIQQQDEVAQNLEEMKDKFDPINIITSCEKFKSMMELYTNDSDDILKFCISNFNLPSNILTITYEYSTILYDTGCYKDCFSVLSLYSCLVDKKTNSYRESLWGQLACSILINDVEQSVELIDIIKNSLDTFSFTKQQQLVNYAYILHWSLFVYFKIPHLIDKFVYMCLHSHCLAAIQMGCPHLIRYLVIAYVMCFEDGDMHKLIEIILQEEYHYSDCFTLFIKSLFCEYDLDSALMHLKNSFDEFKIDYFIREIEEFFSSHAYFLLLKLYAKTHVSVSKSYIMQYFGIDEKLSSFLISKLFGIEEDQTDDIFSTTIASNTSYHQVYIKAKQMLDECLPIDHLSINDS